MSNDIMTAYLTDIAIHPELDVSYMLHPAEPPTLHDPGSLPDIEVTAIEIDLGGRKMMLAPTDIGQDDLEEIEKAIEFEHSDWMMAERIAYHLAKLNVRSL